MSGAPQAVTCAICGRSLLVGEDSTRFSPDGLEYVDVCPLCRDQAMEAGWYREGGSSLPVRPATPHRGVFSRLFRGAPPASEPIAKPILDRLSPDDQVVVEAAGLFNNSSHRRTIEGLTRSLGTPKAAIAPGEGREAVVIVYWDISWYRYLVIPGEAEPVQMIERGFDATALGIDTIEWNADVDAAGRLIPNVVPE
jgi:hypothetical protein